MTSTNTTTSARLYVGTYAKYASGSIAGKWLDLEDYSDSDDFYAACAELHSDESDPEYMFQDFEGFPRELYSESGNVAEVYEWLALSESDREIIGAFMRCFGGDMRQAIKYSEDAYQGEFSSELDFAYDWIESTGMLDGVPETVARYFDYEAFARDLFFDVIRDDETGHVFNRNW